VDPNLSEEIPKGNLPLATYDNWCAIAGFFDGDGGLDIDVRKSTLHCVVNFTDNWAPQLLQIKQFLEAQGVRVGALRSTGMGAFNIEVAAIESLVKFAKGALETRCLFKKRKELQMMIEYFDGRVTGNQVIEFLNEVRSGIRVGKLRVANLPYTYIEARSAFMTGYKRKMLTEEEKSEIRSRYVNEGSTIYQLAPVFGVCPSTIFLAVRGLKRGSGVNR
jgi:hypothetical protein